MSDTSSSNADERSPLIQFQHGARNHEASRNVPIEDLRTTYREFCDLVGNRPVDLSPHETFHANRDSLYFRAQRHLRHQNLEFVLTAAMTNTLLLSQIVLGAVLTGLGATNASGVLVTVFGAVNTIIAGLVAFLKSRGQPMRSRMFRDDLDRVVDEIENSAVMWFGISHGVHGYDAIDTDDSVTVRSEVARLTRLYERAVKANTQNDPDFYGSSSVSNTHSAPLRNRGENPSGAALPTPTTGQIQAAGQPFAGPAADPDESPATSAPTTLPAVPVAKDDATTADRDVKSTSPSVRVTSGGPDQGATCEGPDAGSNHDRQGEE